MQPVQIAETPAEAAAVSPDAVVLEPTVTLPAVESPVVAAAPEPSLPSVSYPVLQFDPASPPILVADDDADDTFFIQRAIKKTGVKNPIKTFDDGSEVVNFLGSIRRGTELMRHRPPLLLFLDLKMAGLGGFAFLEWARQRRKELSPLTIVVLSHTSDPAAMAQALELGAHRYLVKYPSVKTFDSIVRSVYPQTVF